MTIFSDESRCNKSNYNFSKSKNILKGKFIRTKCDLSPKMQGWFNIQKSKSVNVVTISTIKKRKKKRLSQKKAFDKFKYHLLNGGFSSLLVRFLHCHVIKDIS